MVSGYIPTDWLRLSGLYRGGMVICLAFPNPQLDPQRSLTLDVTLDATTSARWNSLELVLAGDNLCDRHYHSGFFWRDEGRVWRAELSWKF